MPRLMTLLLVVALIAGWLAFGLSHTVSLGAIKSGSAMLAMAVSARPALAAIGFLAVYIATTALSLPVAVPLSLIAGALFGLVEGTILVSFGSSIGASLAMLAARFVLREPVRARFGERLAAIDRGVANDGALYLFSLRLAPVIPFFAVNLLMGLTTIRLWTFYWVSQAGMLLASVVYVNAGTRLGTVRSFGDIASPGLLASFAMLGLLPWLGKALVAMLRRRRIYAGWRRPRRFDRNLIVIGGGAAGLVSAYIAATVRAGVTLVEAGKLGGDCLNTGCVPSKALIRSARLAHHFREAGRWGLAPVDPDIRLPAVMARVNAVIRAIEPHDSAERYRALGVEVIEGHARLIDPWTVEISQPGGTTARLTTRAVVIATGAHAHVPDIPGIAASGYWTSDTMWDALGRCEHLPGRIVVLGGGPIGCELAQALARLGAQVTLVERGARLLAREDGDVAALVRESLAASGVTVLTGHAAVAFEQDGSARTVVVEAAGARTPIAYDALIVALGRKARLSGFGLEELGIETAGTIAIDAWMATKYPNILAAGDVAGPWQFTHVAAHQAWYATVNALFAPLKRFRADYRVIPWTTFVDPEVARVGLGEDDARARGIAVEVTRFDLAELDRAIADGATCGFVKVLTPPGRDRILGAVIVGEHAGELLAEFVLAMKHGIGLNTLLGTIHTYPTMAEASRYVAGEWKRNHASERVLRALGRFHAWRRG